MRDAALYAVLGVFVGFGVFKAFSRAHRIGDWITDKTVGAFDRWLSRTCFPDL